MECVNKGLGFTLLAEPDIHRYADKSVKVKPPTEKLLSRQLVLATTNKDRLENMAEELVSLFDT